MPLGFIRGIPRRVLNLKVGFFHSPLLCNIRPCHLATKALPASNTLSQLFARRVRVAFRSALESNTDVIPRHTRKHTRSATPNRRM